MSALNVAMNPTSWPAPLLLLAALMPQAVRAATSDDIQTVVLEHALPKEQGHFVYCLGVDGRDVSSAVFDRLRRTTGLRLSNASECTSVANPREGSIHAASGQPAIFYYVLEFRMDGPASATVMLETYHHGLWASGNRLRLEREDGMWHVVETLPGWVS